MTELSEYLSENEDFEPHAWSVTDDSSASWAMRKLAQAQRRLDDINRQADGEYEKIEHWKDRVSKSPKSDVTYFTNALSQYMIAIRAEGRKSLVLPDGEVTSRAIAPRAAIQDRELFIKWAKENGHESWVRVKEDVDLSALKECVSISGDFVVDAETGETIEGLVGIDADVSVQVKVSGE